MGLNRKQPPYRSEPRWDNSRNVANYGRGLYPVSASLLKHRGTIYHNTPVSDGDGGFTFDRGVRATAWMMIKLLRAEQDFVYRGKNIKATHIIKMRHEIPVNDSDMIAVGGVLYEVIYVDADTDKRRYKTAMCTVMRDVTIGTTTAIPVPTTTGE